MLLTNLRKIHSLAGGEMQRLKKLFIINSIVIAASLFFAVVGVAMENEIAVVGLFFITLPLVTVIPAVALLFRDMTDKRVCDVMHSLPMMASERFWSKILALCYYHIIPTLVVAAAELGLICTRFSEDLADDIKVVWLGYLVGVTALLFTVAVTLLCQMCFGTLAEVIYMTLIALTAFSVFPILVYQNITYAAGFDVMFDSMPFFFCLWTYTSVLAVDDTKVFSFIAGHDNTFSAWPVLIVNVFISIGVIYLCSRLYKKRTAETVGNPIAFKLFLEVLSILAVFVMFEFLDQLNRVVAIGSSMAVFMVVHIILARGKSLKTVFAVRVLEYAVMIGIILIVNLVNYKTGGFGLVFSTPDSSLKHCSVEVELYDYTESDNWYGQRLEHRTLYLEDVDGEKACDIADLLHSHFVSNSDTGWRRYYSKSYANLLVDERKSNQNPHISNPDDKYYWDMVFDQTICFDCDVDTLYQELIDAGMKPSGEEDMYSDDGYYPEEEYYY